MNPKTKQLLEAAGFQYIPHDGIGWAGNHNASLPKLVELVVQECVSNLYLHGYDDAVKQIKQHFEVTDE